jgi:uncharacterized spore protein YtfJ
LADVDEVKARLEGGGDPAGLVGRVAERVGGAARASAVYGEPVERDGVTVIPAARVAFGFGGGSGASAGEGGGGGGGYVQPIGFIEVRAGEATFRPIRDPGRLAAGTIAAVLAAIAIGRAARG